MPDEVINEEGTLIHTAVSEIQEICVLLAVN